MALHPALGTRIDDTSEIVIETQEPALRIIDKTGPRHNPAVPLILGRLVADDYEGTTAHDARIDALRTKMTVMENAEFTREYYEPDKRHIRNALRVGFSEGTRMRRVAVRYPAGHRKRRSEALPLLMERLVASVRPTLDSHAGARLIKLVSDQDRIERASLDEFMRLVVRTERPPDSSRRGRRNLEPGASKGASRGPPSV